MTIDRNASLIDRPERESPEPGNHWVEDCWLIEVMPPTWAWAYRRLLNSGQDPRRFRDRIA